MRLRMLLYAAVAFSLCGCAASLFNPPTNVPISGSTPPNMGARTDFVGENAIILAFSGGGLRAAAFSYGVLEGLRGIKTGDGDLLDDVAAINSVSGGSLTAAYFGLFGREGLDRYAEELLRPGLESGLRTSLLNPRNLLRLLAGGVNDRADLRGALDEKIFQGATFADLYRRGGPDIRIHATDLFYRIPFPFLPPAFELLCSDLSRYRVADAVAASMAVPLVFAPVVLRAYPDRCADDPKELEAFLHPAASAPRGVKASATAAASYRDTVHPRFLRLVDGGLMDNFGVTTLVYARAGFGTPYAPLTAREAVKVRRLLLLVVDASREPSGDWIFGDRGPGGIDVALAAIDAAVDSAARQSVDMLDRMISNWQASVIAFRCGLAAEEVARLGGPEDWHCADVQFSRAQVSVDDLPEAARKKFGSVPTRLSLPREDVDATVAAARQATLEATALRRYLAARVQTKRNVPSLD